MFKNENALFALFLFQLIRNLHLFKFSSVLIGFIMNALLMYNRTSSQSVVTAPPAAAAAAAMASSSCGLSSDSPADFDATQPSTNIQVRLADGSR